jgi:hypothetical protein
MRSHKLEFLLNRFENQTRIQNSKIVKKRKENVAEKKRNNLPNRTGPQQPVKLAQHQARQVIPFWYESNRWDP